MKLVKLVKLLIRKKKTPAKEIFLIPLFEKWMLLYVEKYNWKHQSLRIQRCSFKPVFPSIDTPVENVNRYSFPRIQWLKLYVMQITMSPMASPGGGEQWARHYKCSLQIWVLRHTLWARNLIKDYSEQPELHRLRTLLTWYSQYGTFSICLCAKVICGRGRRFASSRSSRTASEV